MKLLLASEFDVLFPKIRDRGLLKTYKKILYIPTAGQCDNDQRPYFETVVMKQFSALSIKTDWLDLVENTAAQCRAALEDCDIVYVGGGNTFFLLEKMRAAKFKNALPDFFRKGGLYVGSSAGSAVTCPDINYVREADDASKGRVNGTAGLHLVDFSIVPHLDHKGYGPVCRKIADKLKAQGMPSIGLKDNQGLYIQGKYVELI